jgi:hypothetical protein
VPVGIFPSPETRAPGTCQRDHLEHVPAREEFVDEHPKPRALASSGLGFIDVKYGLIAIVDFKGMSATISQ